MPTLLPFVLFMFITFDLTAADAIALLHKQKIDQLRKKSLEEPLLAEVVMHMPNEDEILARKEKMNQRRRESLKEPINIEDELRKFFDDTELKKLGQEFKELVIYVLKAYPSSIKGLYHAIKHDTDHGLINHFNVWELWALHDLLKLKPKIFEQLIDLSVPQVEEFLEEDPKDIEKVKRELLASLVLDLGRNALVFTPTAWEITRSVLRYAYPAQVLKAVEDGMKYSTCAVPIAYAGTAISLINTALLIKRGEHIVFTSCGYSKDIFPRELLAEERDKIKKSHQEHSYLERWVIAAIALIICDLNHIGVLANYAHAGVDMAQLAVISGTLFSGGVMVGTIASISLAAVDQGINLKAKKESMKASAHKKAIFALVGRLLNHNAFIDYLKDIGILQKTLSADLLRKTIATFDEEKLSVFHQLMAIVFKRYLFP